jgi:pilus assembly protein FimV
VAQHTGIPYDDDLTVGADEYNESFSTDYVDLFEPLGDVDAPIAKLKTIILSIDWEITDDILNQLNNELQDLKDVWAGDKINLIYIQAMEKIGRYIYNEKANSHPNAIKLLLTFYYDLEKIVSSATMSEEKKKQLLLQDVKKFDQFKIQIAPPASIEKKIAAGGPGPVAAQTPRVASAAAVPLSSSSEPKDVLTNLKAIVLGIDWEISDTELVRLGEEVNKLEKIFSDSRAKLIFLQGIGALGSYIRSTKSKAHPDAFKLLHSFCHGLEKICNEVLSRGQEKEILLAEVNKFNAFKAVIATVASEVVVPVDDSVALLAEKQATDEEEEGAEERGPLAPAFADIPDDVRGFHVDAGDINADIDKGVATFLGEQEVVATDQFVEAGGETTDMWPAGPELSSRLEALFGDDEEGFEPLAATSDIALEGVHVETEADDDSDEKALPFHGGELAPALAETGGQSVYREETSTGKAPISKTVETKSVIPGVDVETEADDESEEAALPRDQGGLAPALAFSDEEYGFREAELAAGPDEEEFDLEERLDSFFGAEIEESAQGSSFHVSDDAHEQLMPEEVSLERIQVNEIKEEKPAAADLIFEGAGGGASTEATSEDLEVVFEPVADDVTVDELPQTTEALAVEGGIGLEYENLAGLRESVVSIRLNKYETALPSFFAEIKSLRQGWQGQYLKKIFLQLLESVGQTIDKCRGGADAESLMLLQSLCDKLELVCQIKKGLDDGREQILHEETGKVLLWQQGLIAALHAKKGREDDSPEVVDDLLADLFPEE